MNIQCEHIELPTTECPYGWKCPAYFIVRKYGELKKFSVKPLYETDAKCYVCRGLMRHEFQLFITIRCPPWVVNKDAALKMLSILAKKLADIAKLLHLRAVIIIAVGKAELGDGEPRVSEEFPHIHIVVGAEERIGNLRIPREQRIRNLMKFSRQWIEPYYVAVFGGICDKCIYIKWIHYDEKKRGSNPKHGKGKFKLRAYLFKQLISKQYEPIIVGIHIKRHKHKTPSTDEQNQQNLYIIRGYNNSCVSSAGELGGCWSAPARSDGLGIDKSVLQALINSLYADLTSKRMYADLRVDDPGLLLLLKDVLKKLRRSISVDGVDVHDTMRLLYTMYLLVDTWNQVAATNKPVSYVDLCDGVVHEYVENYDFRLGTLLTSLLSFYEFSKEYVIGILKGIASSLRTKLEKVSNGSYEVLGLDAMKILTISVRFQIVSKKKVRKLVKDLQYIENMIDVDARNAAILLIRVGSILSKYIEYSWKRLKRMIRTDVANKRRVRYGSRGSRELQFVVAVKSLIKQIKSFKSMMKEIESLEGLQYLDPDEFTFNAKEMLRNAFPCFLFAGRVVCVNISDATQVLYEAEEVAKYAISFCRYCLGIRVKPPLNPCWSSRDDDKCLERFCSLYDELLGIINGYRELLKKLKRRLRERAKMRKRRYRKRLKKLIYKLSKTRSLSEFIYGSKEDPFTRAIRAFSLWLKRRGYKLVQEYSGNIPDNMSLPQSEAISAELYDKFIKIIKYISDWTEKPSS